MTEWYQEYLDGVDLKKISSLLQQFGINELSTCEWLCKNAALCRLSFASLLLSSNKGQLFQAPQGAIISQTQFGMVKGRPKTARWAFWLGYIVRKELKIQGKQPTSEFLSKLIHILLNRNVPPEPEEVRTVLGNLRKEAEEHATQAAKEILKNDLQQEISEKQYASQMKLSAEVGISPDSQMWPAVENGKVRKEWLKDVIQVRRSILKHVKKHGPLVGQEPIVKIDMKTMFIRDMPEVNLLGSTPTQTGIIHMGKSQTMPVPNPIVEQNIGEVTLSQTKFAQGGGTMSLKFPANALDINQPYAAAILALPVWWPEWFSAQIF